VFNSHLTTSSYAHLELCDFATLKVSQSECFFLLLLFINYCALHNVGEATTSLMRLRGENKLEIYLLPIALLTFKKVYANCMRKH